MLVLIIQTAKFWKWKIASQLQCREDIFQFCTIHNIESVISAPLKKSELSFYRSSKILYMCCSLQVLETVDIHVQKSF